MKAFVQVLVFILASPFVGLAFVAVLGLGLSRGVLPALAALVGLSLTLLPPLGLSSLGRHHPIALALSLLIWPTLLLMAMPDYFPGERQSSVQSGIGFLGQQLPYASPYAEPLKQQSDAVLAYWGEDPTPLPIAQVVEEPTPRPLKTLKPIAGGQPGNKIYFQGEGNRMLVDVVFQGPSGRITRKMLYDTGASVTTLDTKTLSALGVSLTSDAPEMTLHTANGKRQCKVALIEGVQLGDELVDGVSVAVCDDCGTGTSGLLGLNVTGLFQVSMDFEEQSLDLNRRGDHADRLSDVRPWLKVESEAFRRGLGPVEVSVTVNNSSSLSVARADIEVICQKKSFSIEVNDIPPGGQQKTSVSLPGDSLCQEYKVGLAGAYW